MLIECLDTVPFLIYHSNTICQAVAKSSLSYQLLFSFESWQQQRVPTPVAENTSSCLLQNISSEEKVEGEVQEMAKQHY